MESTNQNWFLRFTDRHGKLVASIVIFMTILGIGLITLASFYPIKEPEISSAVVENTTDDTEHKYYSPLTGKEVKDKKTTEKQVVGMMIGNSSVSRPQSGIKQAGVVFEAIAEGGITRYLAMWQEEVPGLIGSVRSVRPYYVDWLAAFDTTIGHVGGSRKALNEVRNGSYKDVDQFFNGNYYYRSTDRPAPHNVYITGKKIEEMNKAKGFTKSKFEGFRFKLDGDGGGTSAKSISVPVSSALYNSSYTYNSKDNNYRRSVGGESHQDREKGQVAPKNVVVIKVPTHIGFEDGYREQMNTTGHNKAYIFVDGLVIDGYWQKTSKKSQIKFFDKLGRVVALNPGQTWITAVAPEKAVSWQ